MITPIRIPIMPGGSEGIYLRWWFNGWHYFNFVNSFEVTMKATVLDVMTTRVFSVISRIERPTKIETEYSYTVRLEGISQADIDGFANLLIAEKVEQYSSGKWYEVDLTRGEKTIREEATPAYVMEFEITRKELPETPAVFQRTTLFYVGDTLADLDSGEVVAINKQVNNIAELQDRQTDFTSQFKIRKTRAMRALFELSGEVGSTTLFPYEDQPCRLVQDGIEIISQGNMVLNKVDENYYYVSVYSGNKNIFTELSKKKITELALPSCVHTWDFNGQLASQSPYDLDYIYPLMEPSDDGGILPLTDTGSGATMPDDKIWPFLRVKAIWEEIFASQGYTVEGDILTDPTFLSLFMPIVDRSAGDVSRYLYSLYNNTTKQYTGSANTLGFPGSVAVNGASDFWWASYGFYNMRYTAKYKVRIFIEFKNNTTLHGYIRSTSLGQVELTLTQSELVTSTRRRSVFEGEFDGTAGEKFTFEISAATVYYYDLSVTSIEKPMIGYSSLISTPALHLPPITQGDFVKAICNMFALVPEASPRDKVIRFWDYGRLYKNISQARDWSAYLSEKNDEVEFKFGDYAKLNRMKYKDTSDVILANGNGVMEISDETLQDEKDLLTIPLSYSDEVIVLNTVNVSRIAMNKYDSKSDSYTQNDKIEPRIVHVSPVVGKMLTFKETGGLEITMDVTDPRKASSIEISFGSLGVRYASLANMLTKTNLRRAKFNLPAYEVAGLKHYIPIYLSQYKAYFYVNKVNNYVVGKLCTIDLIKL